MLLEGGFSRGIDEALAKKGLLETGCADQYFRIPNTRTVQLQSFSLVVCKAGNRKTVTSLLCSALGL